MDLPEQELLSDLSVLKDSELLYERGIYPRSPMSLTYDDPWGSLWLDFDQRKKKLHEQIGSAIEELYKDSLSEHYEALSEHYFLSENYLKAAEYSKLASKKVEKTASFSDAIPHAKEKSNMFGTIAQTVDVQKQVIDARVGLGLYLAQMIYDADAKAAIDPIIDLAKKHNDKRRLCQIYQYPWCILLFCGGELYRGI